MKRYRIASLIICIMLLVSNIGLYEALAAEASVPNGTNTESDQQNSKASKDSSNKKDEKKDENVDSSKENGEKTEDAGAQGETPSDTLTEGNEGSESSDGINPDGEQTSEENSTPQEENLETEESKVDDAETDNEKPAVSDQNESNPSNMEDSTYVDPNGEDNPLNSGSEEDDEKDEEEKNVFEAVIEYYDPNFGTPLLYPLPKEYVITTQYSVIDELHPVGHNGIDYGAPYGTPILAAEEGTVIKAEYYGGYGNCVFVAHENGIETRYAHMSVINVQKGDTVKRGQQIGLVGSTGHSTGPHLHFEVIYNGRFVNPILYLEDRCEAGSQSQKVDGVTITLDVEEGALPKEWELVVKKATLVEKAKIETAIEKTNKSKDKVVKSYAFDIKVLDSHGKEVDPAAGTEVKLSFQMDEVKNENLKVNVFHLDNESLSEKKFDKIKPDLLKVETEEDVATVKPKSFSYYDLEFTQATLEYELNRGGLIDFSEILSKVDIHGDVSNIVVSDESLVSIEKKSDKWFIKADKVFDSEEWMKLTIDGVKYLITMKESKFIEIKKIHGEPRTEIVM